LLSPFSELRLTDVGGQGSGVSQYFEGIPRVFRWFLLFGGDLPSACPPTERCTQERQAGLRRSGTVVGRIYGADLNSVGQAFI